MNLWSKIKGIIGTVAPVVGSALGGPFGGAIAGGLCNIFGLKSKDINNPKKIEAALAGATAEQWIEIKKLEIAAEQKARELDLDEKKLDQEYEAMHAKDRASARERETRMAESGNRDFTPSILAIGVTVGFFGLLYAFAFHSINVQAKDMVEIMIGSLGTGFTMMLGYYFGSSRGSSEKNKVIGGALTKIDKIATLVDNFSKNKR